MFILYIINNNILRFFIFYNKGEKNNGIKGRVSDVANSVEGDMWTMVPRLSIVARLRIRREKLRIMLVSFTYEASFKRAMITRIMTYIFRGRKLEYHVVIKLILDKTIGQLVDLVFLLACCFLCI